MSWDTILVKCNKCNGTGVANFTVIYLKDGSQKTVKSCCNYCGGKGYVMIRERERSDYESKITN